MSTKLGTYHQISRGSGKVPLAYAKVSSELLSHVSPVKAEESLKRVIEHFDGEVGDAKVSRIDLFVDFVSSVDMESWDRQAWVTRARSINAYSVDSHFSGWSIGIGGIISARLYDKTLEIQKSHKTYLFDLWRQAGWDGHSKVWRLEFELKRDVLVEHGLIGLESVLSNLSGLWSYATNEWLRLTIPKEDDETRSRWPIHPLWGCLSSVDWDSSGGPLSARYSNERLPRKEKIFGLYFSALTSYMAMTGVHDMDAAAYDLYGDVCNHFQSISSLIGTHLSDFVLDKVADKERLYNTRMNANQEQDIEEAKQAIADEYRKLSDGE